MLLNLTVSLNNHYDFQWNQNIVKEFFPKSFDNCYHLDRLQRYTLVFINSVILE